MLSGWKQRTFIFLLLSITSLAAYHFGSLAGTAMRQQDSRPPIPTVYGLSIEPRTLELGEVWETPRYTFPIRIHNSGSVPRTIERFQTTCGCLQLDPPGKTIPPGEQADFVGSLELTPRHSSQIGVARWELSVRLDPVFQGDFVATRGWEVNGVVLNRLSVSTLQLAFENRCNHQGERAWRKVHIRTHLPLKSIQAIVVPNIANVRVEPGPDELRDYVLHVSPNPSLPVGRFRFEVQLEAVTPDNQTYPCSTVEVVGEMQPAYRVIPRMVFLGEHPIPTNAEGDVTLRLPAAGWKIDRIQTDSPDTVVTQFDAEEGRRLHVKQRITKLGDQGSVIQIVLRKPDNQTEVVPVEVRYHGLDRAR